MNLYFKGCINQQLERGQLLLLKIPSGLPREFHVLSQRCRDHLAAILHSLRSILADPGMESVDVQPELLRKLRRAVRDMDILETAGIAALNRHTDDDIWLNELVQAISTETRYPLVPPVITLLSDAYFEIHLDINLLRVPLAEGHFLLHLPDLYHEIAHPLLADMNDPRLAPFQQGLGNVIDAATLHFTEERRRADRIHAPVRLAFYLDNWLRHWMLAWPIEFFCDLFATCLAGPAYVWSHFHLTAKRGQELYMIPQGGLQTHPPDHARMSAMLACLDTMGFAESAGDIRGRWDQLASLTGQQPSADYHYCFPQDLMTQLVTEAVSGIDRMGCVQLSPEEQGGVAGVLNDAWVTFWQSPPDYPAWEKKKVADLKREYSMTRRAS